MARLHEFGRRAALPCAIFALCAGVYVATLGSRVRGTAPNAHFVHLADSFLHGQLHVVGDKAPGDNDWARYEGRWYVSFPPLPAVIILPAVAVWGTKVWDRLFWAIFAGLGPACLFLLLRRLRETGRSHRTVSQDVALTALFAFGTVYFFVSVQGTTWFAAHVVATPLLALFALWSLNAARPLSAGLMLALCFLTRPHMAFAGVFFLVEALGVSRAPDAPEIASEAHPLKKVWCWLSGVRWAPALRKLALFSLPVLAVGAVMMWMNHARFDDPMEFGHSFLQVKWRYRIQKWGLVNYHFLGRNLAVFLASLPWLAAAAPYIKISRHGLALWFTTPQLLLTLWPKRVSATMVGLYLSVVLVALLGLSYQNSGWIQFGYRFSLDYMILLFVLLALGGRRFGPVFYGLMVFAFAVNLFGAITFDRYPSFYSNDATQRVIFQPD